MPLRQGRDDGPLKLRATTSPAVATAGEWGQWTIRVSVVSGSIDCGANFYFQLPRSWYVGPYMGAKGVHSTNPQAANYVSARASRGKVECVVEGGADDEFVLSHRRGIDGRRARNVWVARVDLLTGTLTRGDWVEVVFGDMRQGGAGFRASLHPEGEEPVQIGLRAGFEEPMRILDEATSPSLSVVPAAPAELLVVVPSTVAPDEPTSLSLLVLDEFANRVTDYEGKVALVCATGDCGVPSQLEFTRLNAGRLEVPIEPKQGVIRIEAKTPGMPTAYANPMRVVDPDDFRLYWGDLHSHAADSADAVGGSPFIYARDVACLDFFALTEHAEGWADGAWDRIKIRTEAYNEPGRFVTILAYEAGFGPPWGHHNVFFKGTDGPVVSNEDADLISLWEALDTGDALTIPHHSGIRWRTPQPMSDPGLTPNPDWSYDDPGLRPTIEIYSLHGQSELYDPSHPLSYEQLDHTLAASVDGPHYATDAWRAGLRMGVVASSDDHAAQPGRVEGGLAAVWARSLDRESIFEAIRERRTFGTTGTRSIIHLTINGTPGDHSCESAPIHEVSIEVNATYSINRVELVRQVDGQLEHDVVSTWRPATRDFSVDWSDPTPHTKCLYYARLIEGELRRGRIVQSWSSPVWLGNW